MGASPVPTEEHSRIIRARGVLAATEAAAATTAAAGKETPAKNKLPKIVANITDPDSRVMPTLRGFVQGYNTQLAVTSDHIITAVDVNRNPNDMRPFVPMMTAAVDAVSMLHETTGSPEHQVGIVLADAGYCSNTNLEAPDQIGSSHWARAGNKPQPHGRRPPSESLPPTRLHARP